MPPEPMPPLSDLAIQRAKPSGKTQKLFDGGGLYLEISPAGGRWWRLKYRFGGKEKRLALGVYPEVTLALARNRREDARRLLAQGTDPSQQKKDAAAAKAGLGALTFESIGREWMKGRIWAPSYRIKVEAWMENDVFPWIGSRQAADLEAPDFLSIARRMERRGAIESGHRVIQNCGQIMRYAIASGLAKRNPAADLRGALQPKPKRHYAALAEPKELAPLRQGLQPHHAPGGADPDDAGMGRLPGPAARGQRRADAARSGDLIVEGGIEAARDRCESGGLGAEAVGSAAAACPVFPAAGAVTVQLGALLP